MSDPFDCDSTPSRAPPRASHASQDSRASKPHEPLFEDDSDHDSSRDGPPLDDDDDTGTDLSGGSGRDTPTLDGDDEGTHADATSPGSPAAAAAGAGVRERLRLLLFGPRSFRADLESLFVKEYDALVKEQKKDFDFIKANYKYFSQKAKEQAKAFVREVAALDAGAKKGGEAIAKEETREWSDLMSRRKRDLEEAVKQAARHAAFHEPH